MNPFGKNLKKILVDRGISQRDFAMKVGMSEVTISRYISDQRAPKGPGIVKIAKELGVSTDDLLKESDERYHDMIKDPKDLPPIAHTVLAYFKNGEVSTVARYADSWAYNQAHALRQMAKREEQEIIGWRLVKPHKEKT